MILFNSHLLLLLLLTATLLLFLPAAKPDLAGDRAALLALSAAVGGTTLRWNRTLFNPCSWQGITCDRQHQRVEEVRLPGSVLSGDLPAGALGNLTQLRVLSLRRNSLTGPIPPDLASCRSLRVLNLKDNGFSGDLPATILANLSNLVRLDLAENCFSGEIPQELSRLRKLRTLHLEGNNLTGPIPDLRPLEKFNVSHNTLNGSIPTGLRNFSRTAFLGNLLCGPPLNPCPENDTGTGKDGGGSGGGGGGGSKLSGLAIAGIVIGAVVIVFVIIVILFFVLYRNKIRAKVAAAVAAAVPEKQPEFEFQAGSAIESGTDVDSGAATVAVDGSDDDKDDGLVWFGRVNRVFGMRELLEAPAEVLGRGVIGTTYKACLGGGMEVVVKRLRNVGVFEWEFRERAEKLGGVRHENVFPLKGYFYGKDEKLLLFDHEPTGSLSALLHGMENVRPSAQLSWEARGSIAIGVARGIEHLHSQGFVHGNIKSCNVFVSENYSSARVAEFGIAQLVASSSSRRSFGGAVSEQLDIHSFGILLIELLTGKIPTTDHPDELPKWVESMAKERWATEVFDPELIGYRKNEPEMVKLLVLAMSCVSDKWQTMAEVRRQVEGICSLGK